MLVREWNSYSNLELKSVLVGICETLMKLSGLEWEVWVWVWMRMNIAPQKVLAYSYSCERRVEWDSVIANIWVWDC